MAAILRTNLASLNAQRRLERTSDELATAVSRLSSGLRVNSAKDDAAGLAIADRFTARLRGINQAARNANDGISTAQVAEGALASVAGNLQRLRELAVQAANGTPSSSDRAALQLEVRQLVDEIDRVGTQTAFNGNKLLDGSFPGSSFQVGADQGQTIGPVAMPDVRASSLGTYQGVSLTNQVVVSPSNSPRPLILQAEGVSIAIPPVAADAKAVVLAMNGAGVRGLTLTANATAVAAGTSAAAATASGTAVFTVNGVAISLAGTSGGAALGANRAAAVGAINAQSAATGVVATDTGAGVALTAADGRNITTSYAASGFTGSTVADFGLAAAGTTAATFNVEYVAPPGAVYVTLAQNSGFVMVPLVGPVGQPLAAIDIGSADGASQALASIDRALASVNGARASLGAVQNRFTAAIGQLQAAAGDVAAARSRIIDADFAEEAAKLSRSQILQQAGTAMVAQANQQPQQVVQLLR